jgi:chromosome segregation ATPase
MKTFLLIAALLAALSCKTLTTSESQRLNEQLNSENRLLNKKMMLILRQNSVYVEENLIYKRSLDQKTAQYEKLRGDMESLERKLQGDIALLEGKNRNLKEKNRILEAQSSEKIRELTELNKQMEKRLGDEIAALNAAVKKSAEEFGRQKEQLMLLAAQKDFEHSKQSEELKKNIAAKDAEVSELKTKNAEFAMKLAEAKKAQDDAGAAMKNLELDISRLREGLAAAEKDRKELREQLDRKSAQPPDGGAQPEKKTAPGAGQNGK